MRLKLNNHQLNDQQLEMIRLFKTPWPDEYFMQIKRLAIQLLGERLGDTMEKWEKENDINEAWYEDLSKEHLRASSAKQP